MTVDRQTNDRAHPRAPMRGPSREALIKILERADAEAHLPIILAMHAPDAIVQKEKDRWVIRSLVENQEMVSKASQEANATDTGFMDENSWPYRQAGLILIGADSKEDFIQAVAKMKWLFGAEDGRGEGPFLKPSAASD